MTTLATVERTQPAYRAFDVTVTRVHRLSPSFARITFAGHDLDEFGRDGLDQRIKLVLPAPDGSVPRAHDFQSESWYQDWRALPEERRNPFRTYTVRAVRPAVLTLSGRGEVDVDVVLHGDDGGRPGPAARWVRTVQPGDRCVLNGPNELHDGPPVGIEWAPPATASTLLLAGDETAAPAITAIVESLPAGTRAHAYIEVPEEGDALPVVVPEGVTLTWLPRHTAAGTAHAHGELLDAAVRECMQARRDERIAANEAAAEILAAAEMLAGVEPEDVDVDATILWDTPFYHSDETGPLLADCYAWIAGEAAVVRDLRRHLVRDLGIDRRSVAFMGYWRRGRAEN